MGRGAGDHIGRALLQGKCSIRGSLALEPCLVGIVRGLGANVAGMPGTGRGHAEFPVRIRGFPTRAMAARDELGHRKAHPFYPRSPRSHTTVTSWVKRCATLDS